MKCETCEHALRITDHYDLLHRKLYTCEITRKTMKADDDCVVEKPSHYVPEEGVECIDYLRQVLTPQEFLGYCRGNVIKYQHLANLKGTPELDLRKSANYALLAAGYDFRKDLVKNREKK